MGRGIIRAGSTNLQCVQCSKPFERTNGSQRHCSRACAFWAKVDVRGPEDCWPWTASARKGGYGRFWSAPAPRYAWELVNGPMPLDRLACHTCDNPPCCNPAHIWAGTPSENTRDAVKKQRRVGELCPGAKLSELDVREIVRRLQNGELPKAIAPRFGVGFSVIYRIKSGDFWSHVTGGAVHVPEAVRGELLADATRRRAAGNSIARRRERTC